jgi:DNA-binding transcriptional ArsR family regulator
MDRTILLKRGFEKPEGFALLLMMAMAEMMDNNNLVWESVQSISDNTGVSTRTVSRGIKKLLELNIIRKYKDTVYIMNPYIVSLDGYYTNDGELVQHNDTLIQTWEEL